MERVYRPPSYSDSFIRSPSSFQLEMAANLLVSHTPGSPTHVHVPLPQPQPSTLYTNALKFSFHLFLISIFETAFYFAYVSRYENRAILSLTGTYIDDLGNTCSNLTATEHIFWNTVLGNLLNVTQIRSQAAAAAANRDSSNETLLHYSILYVSSLFLLFGGLSIGTWFFSKPVKWREIFQENAAVMVFLAAYEYLFFRTIVIQYSLTSAPEINGDVVRELQTKCDLLTTI
jgi:hypothetical protein